MPLKDGMKCRIRTSHPDKIEYNLKEGQIYKLYEDAKSMDVYFDDGNIVNFLYSEVYLPLHSGVFLENEKPSDWFAQIAVAKANLHAHLVIGSIEKIEDLTKFDFPDEVLEAFKKIIDVLGSKEGIALIQFLLSVL